MTLIERLEALSGPFEGIHPICDEIHALLPEPKCVQPPDYLRSIDAAMSLVPEGVNSGEVIWNVEGWSSNGVHAPHVRATAWVAGAPRVYAATPAIALCAAALKVRGL